MFSLIGRILFYRDKHKHGSFKEKLKVRLVSWLWEIPVLIFFGFLGLAVMSRYQLLFEEAALVSMIAAYMGLETLKMWIYDWVNAKAEWMKQRKGKKDD